MNGLRSQCILRLHEAQIDRASKCGRSGLDGNWPVRELGLEDPVLDWSCRKIGPRDMDLKSVIMHRQLPYRDRRWVVPSSQLPQAKYIYKMPLCKLLSLRWLGMHAPCSLLLSISGARWNSGCHAAAYLAFYETSPRSCYCGLLLEMLWREPTSQKWVHRHQYTRFICSSYIPAPTRSSDIKERPSLDGCSTVIRGCFTTPHKRLWLHLITTLRTPLQPG
jgi:hypothetical protein